MGVTERLHSVTRRLHFVSGRLHSVSRHFHSVFRRVVPGILSFLLPVFPILASPAAFAQLPSANRTSAADPYWGSVTAQPLSGEPLKLSLDDAVRRGLKSNLGVKEAENGQLALLLYITAANPVGVQIALPSMLLGATAPYGGSVQIGVPLVPSFPDAPDVAVVQLTATLGPLGITYYERVHGHTIAYHPQGVLLPEHCPRGGFPFAAELGFVDGSTASARTVVPCPGHVK